MLRVFLNSSATDIVLVTLPKHGIETAVAQCTSRWAMARGHLTLPLFWRRPTVSPVFFGRYPRSSHYSFVPPSLPIPNKPSRFCGRKAKCTPPLVSRLNLDTLETRRTVTKTTMMYKLTSSQDDISPNPHTHRKTSSRSSWRACRNILMGRYVYPMSYREPD